MLNIDLKLYTTPSEILKTSFYISLDLSVGRGLLELFDEHRTVLSQFNLFNTDTDKPQLLLIPVGYIF